LLALSFLLPPFFLILASYSSLLLALTLALRVFASRMLLPPRKATGF
jgi:hypothetical protein